MARERLQLLCFQLGTRLFALDIMGIREILRNQKFTPLPHTPPHIAGVLNLRGELIPVMNLHRILLGTPGEGPAGEAKLVVVHAQGKTAGLLVDQVLDVLSIPASSLTPLPAQRWGESQVPVVLAAFRRGGEANEVVVLVRLAPLVEAQGAMGAEEAPAR